MKKYALGMGNIQLYTLPRSYCVFARSYFKKVNNIN